MNEPIDFLGCPIEEGDVIVYPVRRGADLYLRRMQIIAIKKILTVDKLRFKLIGINTGGRQVTVTHPERIIVVG